MLELFIEVDTNDCDFESETSKITEELFEQIKPVIEAIAARSGDYQTRDAAEISMTEKYPQFSKQFLEEFEDLCPCPEYGFHTIESITICPYVNKTILL